jgi:hypothetical protein
VKPRSPLADTPARSVFQEIEKLGSAKYGGLPYYVRTYNVRMNLTLSIEEKLLARACELLERLTRGLGPADVMAKLDRLWIERTGRSGGLKWNRGEVYDRPVLRRP